MSAKGRKPDAKELAERLRANLRRRKEQLRARQQAEDTAANNGDNANDGK